MGDLGPQAEEGVVGEVGEFGWWDLAGLAVPEEDSGGVGWPGTEGGGGSPPRPWHVGPRDCLVERAKDLSWGLQGGAGQTWRRGRRSVGVGL